MQNGHISDNIRGKVPYPPTLATKALWLFSWLHPHADSKQRYMDEKN